MVRPTQARPNTVAMISIVVVGALLALGINVLALIEAGGVRLSIPAGALTHSLE